MTKPSNAVSTKDKTITSLDSKPQNVKSADIDPEVEVGHVSSEVVVEKQAAVELAVLKTEAEERAENITDAQIKKYWKAREAERISGRGRFWWSR